MIINTLNKIDKKQKLNKKLTNLLNKQSNTMT